MPLSLTKHAAPRDGYLCVIYDYKQTYLPTVAGFLRWLISLLAVTYTSAVLADKALPTTNDLTPATWQRGKYVG